MAELNKCVGLVDAMNAAGVGGARTELPGNRHGMLLQPWVDALLLRVWQAACRELVAAGFSVADERVARLVHLPGGVLCRYVASPARSPKSPAVAAPPVFLLSARLALVDVAAGALRPGTGASCELSLAAQMADAPAEQVLVRRPLAHVPLAMVPMTPAELEAVLSGVLLEGPAGREGGLLRVHLRRFTQELGRALNLPVHALTVRTPTLGRVPGVALSGRRPPGSVQSLAGPELAEVV